MVELTREVRFGLMPEAEKAGAGANGFAGNPALTGIDPYLSVFVTMRGQIDPGTGMLVNIKQVDRVVREIGVPLMRDAHYQRRSTAADPHRRSHPF